MATAPMNLQSYSFFANDSQISKRARGLAKLVLGLALLVMAGVISARANRIRRTAA